MPSVSAKAEETLKHSGKLQFKQERIGRDDQSSLGEVSAQMETELEKVAPDLFKEETALSIKEKQTKTIESQNNLENMLFIQQGIENTVLEDTETSLFATDYTAPQNRAQEDSIQASDSEGKMGTMILSSLIGVALAICGGIYAFMRKAFE